RPARTARREAPAEHAAGDARAERADPTAEHGGTTAEPAALAAVCTGRSHAGTSCIGSARAENTATDRPSCCADFRGTAHRSTQTGSARGDRAAVAARRSDRAVRATAGCPGRRGGGGCRGAVLE